MASSSVLLISCSWLCVVCFCTAAMQKTSYGIEAKKNAAGKQFEILVEDEENYGAFRIINSTDDNLEFNSTDKDSRAFQGNSSKDIYMPDKDSAVLKLEIGNLTDKNKVINQVYGNFTSDDIQTPQHDPKKFERKYLSGDEDVNHEEVRFVRHTSPALDKDMVRMALQQEQFNKIFMMQNQHNKTIQKRSFNLWNFLGMGKEEPKTVLKITEEIPVPVPYTVEKKIPVPMKVEVERPVPVEVPKPYPVTVEKKVYYPVKEYVYAPYPVYKKVPYMVKLLVEKQIPVHISKPYPVYIEKKVPYPVEKQIPVAVKVPVDRPYPVPVPVFKNVYYPVEKKVPYAVPIAVEKPVAVPVEKPYPVYIEKQVPVKEEKSVPFAVPIPIEEHQTDNFEGQSFDSSSFAASEEQKTEYDGNIPINELRKADIGFSQQADNTETDGTKPLTKESSTNVDSEEEQTSELTPQNAQITSSQKTLDEIQTKKEDVQEFGRRINN